MKPRKGGSRDQPVGDGRPGTRRKSAPRSAAVDKAADRPVRKAPTKPRRPPGEPGAGGVGGTVKAKPEGPMRVQRALARAGLVSRREADRAVAEGRVQVNGQVAQVGQTIDPATDRVALDGNTVRLAVDVHRWIVLHKPGAVVTTRRDPAGRKTVFDLVDQVPGLVYVGRLDFMTEGVLLLTTDGRAAHALTHPSNEVERTYVATVRGDAPTAVREARRGVRLEDGLVVPRDVSAHPVGDRRWAFQVTIAEGRTHEVRRLCEALGLEVERLVRTQFGPVRLGSLAAGETRALTPGERDVLEALVPTR
ncbi:MAG: pseudouridine synthase [Gemmatimonas sp.]